MRIDFAERTARLCPSAIRNRSLSDEPDSLSTYNKSSREMIKDPMLLRFCEEATGVREIVKDV